MAKIEAHFKKYVLSNQKNLDFFNICNKCLKDLNVFKIRDYNLILKKLLRSYHQTILPSPHHDQHHFKSVILIACLLAKLSKLKI